MLTEEKFDDTGARLEHIHGKSTIHLAQETGVSKSSARKATQLPKLRPYKITAIHSLQPRDPASSVHFCSWFPLSVVEDETDPQLTFFSDETRFEFQGYINTQNNPLCLLCSFLLYSSYQS
jgi:hypothetical protein